MTYIKQNAEKTHKELLSNGMLVAIRYELSRVRDAVCQQVLQRYYLEHILQNNGEIPKEETIGIPLSKFVNDILSGFANNNPYYDRLKNNIKMRFKVEKSTNTYKIGAGMATDIVASIPGMNAFITNKFMENITKLNDEMTHHIIDLFVVSLCDQLQRHIRKYCNTKGYDKLETLFDLTCLEKEGELVTFEVMGPEY